MILRKMVRVILKRWWKTKVAVWEMGWHIYKHWHILENRPKLKSPMLILWFMNSWNETIRFNQNHTIWTTQPKISKIAHIWPISGNFGPPPIKKLNPPSLIGPPPYWTNQMTIEKEKQNQTTFFYPQQIYLFPSNNKTIFCWIN